MLHTPCAQHTIGTHFLFMALSMATLDTQLQECYSLTSNLLENDPYATEAYPVHITASLELRKKNELFRRAHKYATHTWSKHTSVNLLMPNFRTVAAAFCETSYRLAQVQGLLNMYRASQGSLHVSDLI